MMVSIYWGQRERVSWRWSGLAGRLLFDWLLVCVVAGE